MASSWANKSYVGRAAAILTTSEVAGNALDLNNAWGSRVTVDLTFTLGALTNVIVRFYASWDGVTYKPLYMPFSGGEYAETLTADAERCYVNIDPVGWKFFRVSVQGTGTVTGSSCAFSYRVLKYGSQ